MLLAAFAFLPLTLQTQVAAALRTEVGAHTTTVPAGSTDEWVALLTDLNPVLSWSPGSNSLELAPDGWQRLLQLTAIQWPSMNIGADAVLTP